MNNETLKKLCEPVEGDNTYFRPFICKGEVKPGGIFLIGINPATSITSKEVRTLDEFVDLISDYDKFMEKYKAIRRRRKGKSELSRTRMGIMSLVEELNRSFDLPVFETNVNSFPTKNAKELVIKEKSYPKIKERGEENFETILQELQPRLLITHGKKSLVGLMDYFINNKALSLNIKCEGYKNLSIKEVEFQYNPVAEIILNGKAIPLLACRHLMYYGKNGKSFGGFLREVKSLI